METGARARAKLQNLSLEAVTYDIFYAHQRGELTIVAIAFYIHPEISHECKCVGDKYRTHAFRYQFSEMGWVLVSSQVR